VSQSFHCSSGRNRNLTDFQFKLSTGINSTASYFGDEHLSREEIDTIVVSIFEKSVRLSRDDCIRLLSSNPYVKRFASGKRRTRVQFKKDLVTEIKIDSCNTVHSPNIMTENRLLPGRRFWRRPNNGVRPLSPRTQQHVESLLDITPSSESLESTNTSKINPKTVDPPSTSHRSCRFGTVSRSHDELRDPPTEASF
jgi:hypothetical protein